MRLTTAAFDPERFRERFLRRSGAFVLALVLELLIGLMLFLWLAPVIAPKPKEKPLITFGLDGEPAQEAAPHARAEARAKAKGSTDRANDPVPNPQAPPPPNEVQATETLTPSNTIWLTPRQYAATDVSKTRGDTGAGAQSPADSDSNAGGNSGDTAAMGRRGPNGEPLYPAEWYREPRDSELGMFKPNPEAEGWGEIACRTAPRYRVEDCVELADYPRGSRLAGAVRQAAPAFLVRPPRKGGKPMIGVWVYIRITYTVTRVSR